MVARWPAALPRQIVVSGCCFGLSAQILACWVQLKGQLFIGSKIRFVGL